LAVSHPLPLTIKIAAQHRIVISVPVVVEIGLFVVVLAGKPQVVGDGAVGLNLSFTVGQIGCGPDHSAGGVDQLLRGGKVIIEEEVQARAFLVFPHRQGFVVQVHVIADRGAVRLDFRDQPAVQIVGIGGKHRVALSDLHQAVERIPGIRQTALGDDVAVGVVDKIPDLAVVEGLQTVAVRADSGGHGIAGCGDGLIDHRAHPACRVSGVLQIERTGLDAAYLVALVKGADQVERAQGGALHRAEGQKVDVGCQGLAVQLDPTGFNSLVF